MAEKTPTQQLAEKLLYKPAYVADKDADVKQKAHAFAEGYKKFLDNGKTEREVAAESEQMLKDAGYVEFDPKKTYQPGDKVYFVQFKKAVVASTIGTRSFEDGFRLVIAHTDSPRLDLRPTPLYESDHLSYFKTHYYGGIRKYQWLAMPLALHGVVVREDGEVVNITVGENEDEPAMYITDLLPHLAAADNAKPVGTAFPAEKLNVLVGSRPLDGEEKDAVKANVLAYLNEKYGITEADFQSAELCIVPAGRARDVGFDRSMICAYGHDDRCCAYPSLTAQIDADEKVHTTMCILADKEEIGSEGVSGMQCSLILDLISALAQELGGNDAAVRANSKCLSSDVGATYDPNFDEVYEKRNAALINCGVAMCKFTGARGKSGTSDASAELVGWVRRCLNGAGVVWQTCELGKIDVGGGGTIAKYMANHNIDTIDLGVPVLSMHAPYEVIAKTDLYEAYRAFVAFYHF